jgi:(2Fe-2S) ferredoxin
MADTTPPAMRSYGRHVLICTHGDCAPSDAGLPLQQRFAELARDYGLNKLRNPRRVKCSLADCLGVCKGGPIVAVYPEGVWYHHVDLPALEHIFREHLVGGRPVEALAFHRLYPQGHDPAPAPDVRGDPVWENQD